MDISETIMRREKIMKGSISLHKKKSKISYFLEKCVSKICLVKERRKYNDERHNKKIKNLVTIYKKKKRS